MYHAIIEHGEQRHHLSAKTASRLSSEIGQYIERNIDQAIMGNMKTLPITITPYSPLDCFVVNEQSGEWENEFPKTRNGETE